MMSTPAKFEECAVPGCGHFPSWHGQRWPRPKPWLGAPTCGAWTPDGRCPCTGWQVKHA